VDEQNITNKALGRHLKKPLLISRLDTVFIELRSQWMNRCSRGFSVFDMTLQPFVASFQRDEKDRGSHQACYEHPISSALCSLVKFIWCFNDDFYETMKNMKKKHRYPRSIEYTPGTPPGFWDITI
jgi:ABC-type uncharacterized transport system permease subunit